MTMLILDAAAAARRRRRSGVGVVLRTRQEQAEEEEETAAAAGGSALRGMRLPLCGRRVIIVVIGLVAFELIVVLLSLIHLVATDPPSAGQHATAAMYPRVMGER